MAGGKNKRSAPTVPWWLVWLGGILAAIVGILSSLDKIQDYLCRHGLTAACSNRFVLVLSTWPADIAGGWIADISNPTAYQATISDARLVFKRPSPQMPIAMTVIPAPKDWKSTQACNAPEPAIPPVSLGPQTATQLRLLLYAAGVRGGNQWLMAHIDQQIPERMSIKCELQVDIVAGDGHQSHPTTEFDCSRLPYPLCH